MPGVRSDRIRARLDTIYSMGEAHRKTNPARRREGGPYHRHASCPSLYLV